MTDFNKTPIIDLFESPQGEGSLTGIRHFFIRTSGCNLRCNFANSICDTSYSSFAPERSKFSLSDVVEYIESHSNISHICLTGGEPTLYPDFIKWIRMTFPNHHLTIETNGTIFPGKEIAKNIDLASISPKMLSSIDPSDVLKSTREEYIRKSNLHIADWIYYAKQTQLKYVTSCEKDIYEILNHITLIEKKIGESLNRDFIYLMPAGSSFEELCQTRPIVGELAKKYGFSISDRIQFNFFGSKREA